MPVVDMRQRVLFFVGNRKSVFLVYSTSLSWDLFNTHFLSHTDHTPTRLCSRTRWCPRTPENTLAFWQHEDHSYTHSLHPSCGFTIKPYSIHFYCQAIWAVSIIKSIDLKAFLRDVSKCHCESQPSGKTTVTWLVPDLKMAWKPNNVSLIQLNLEPIKVAALRIVLFHPFAACCYQGSEASNFKRIKSNDSQHYKSQNYVHVQQNALVSLGPVL